MTWKTIIDYPNYEINIEGEVRNKKRGSIMKTSIEKGYKRVGLCMNNIKKHFFIHRLIAIYFLENSDPSYTTIDHIDRDKLNNTITNLRWCNNSMNMQNKDYCIKKGSHHHIHKHHNKFVVEFTKGITGFQKRVFSSSHDTIEEAIESRNEYMKKNPR